MIPYYFIYFLPIYFKPMTLKIINRAYRTLQLKLDGIFFFCTFQINCLLAKNGEDFDVHAFKKT